MFFAPDFARVADQHERDVAGAVERRIEGSLHRYWLSLARARTTDWWNELVPAAVQAEAGRQRRGRGSSQPQAMVGRLALGAFLQLFVDTFPSELDAILGAGNQRRAYIFEVLAAARDAAAHPGRPFLAVEARMAAALAWDIAHRIPVEYHDPPDQVAWLATQHLVDAEGFAAEAWEICADCLITPQLWANLHQLVAKFKAIDTSPDSGFSRAIEGLLGAAGLNVFLRAGELTLGSGLPAFSGLFHEHDLGVIAGSQLVVMELKHRRRGRVLKDDLLLFNQKTLDFELALIRAGRASRMLRAFVTNDQSIKDSLRAFCIQWGIVLIEPKLPPIPSLVAALRDLDGTATAAASPRFDAALGTAEMLAAAIRPLDRILVPSTLSSWRRLIDAGAFPSGLDLDALVRAHHDLSGYAMRLVING